MDISQGFAYPLEKINQFGRIWHKLQYQINIHQCQCLIWNHRMNIFVWNEIKVWIRLVLSKRTRNTLKQSRMEWCWCTVSVEVQTVRDPFQIYLTWAPEHDNFKPESHMKYCYYWYCAVQIENTFNIDC